MRQGGEPDPFGAHVVHVGKDCGNRADLAWVLGWKLCIPRSGIEMFNQKLIDAIVGNKDSSGCFIELGTRRRWSLGQGGLPWLLSSKFIVPPFSRCEELKSRSAKRVMRF